MCGIVGFVTAGDSETERRAVIDRMLEMVDPRGPDSRAVLHRESVALGHSRLAILDLSPLGAQPMSSHNETLTIVYNGEIYNFLELATELRTLGHEFRGRSDTEVILAAFLEWGDDCFRRFNGMFSIALVDWRDRSIRLVRDRWGKKPLFYSHDSKRLYFGSTLLSVVRGRGELQCNGEALIQYLACGYPLGRLSLASGVERVMPGEILQLSFSGGVISAPSRAFHFDLESLSNAELGSNDPTQTLEELLSVAVRARLISDRPVGLFLSGGLDSSIVALLAKRHAPEELVHGFTCAFPGTAYDESVQANEIAQHLGLKLHTVSVPSPVATDVESVIGQMGEPLGDSSYFGFYYLARAAKERVAVVLSGDGADEVFAGYTTYLASDLAQLPFLRTSFFRGLLRFIGASIPPSDGKVAWDYKLRAFAEGLSHPFPASHFAWRTLCPVALRGPVLERQTAKRESRSAVNAPERAIAQLGAGKDWLRQARLVDFRSWLANDILVKVDLASMSHGLEVRAPFLDANVVRFGFSLPQRLLLSRTEGKVILRRLGEKLLPQHVAVGRKRGFNAPVPLWLRDELYDMARSVFGSSASGLGLSSTALLSLLDQHRSRRADHGYFLWAVLVLLVWFERAGRGASR